MGCCNSGSSVYIPRPYKDAGCRTSCTDGSPAECCDKNLLTPRRNRMKVKEKVKDFVLYMLGAPTIKLEINEQALDMAVDQALSIYESYAPKEHFNYYVFPTTPGKSVYEMPPDVGYIRNVYYRETPALGFTAGDIGGAIPVEYFYPGGSYSSMQGGLIDPVQPIWGNAGSWWQYKSYQTMFSRLSSSIGGWEWVDGYQNIKLYPVPCGTCAVMVHYLQKCKDWQCTNQFMQEYALALTKIIIGRIRSRIKNPPGANGGIQLDGDQLLQEGKEEKQKLEEDLINKYGELLGPTMD